MNQNRPQPPPPWIPEFDYQSQRWLFVNQQTGERTWEFPQSRQYGAQSYTPQPTNNYGGYDERAQQDQPSHAGRNTAFAAVGGLLAGGLLMHEGHKVEEHWDQDKDRIENRVDYDRDRVENRYDDDRDRVENRIDDDRDRFDNRVAYDEQRVEDFPDDAARWTGRKVQDVEDIPEDVAGWAGRKEQEVEDIPDDVAGWAGQKVGDVERWDDNVQDSYDDGRDEQRYDDDRRDDGQW